MKAQSIRRLVTLVCGALALGIVGVGALYATKIRPAAADDPGRAKWVEPSMKEWNTDISHVNAKVSWTVREDDFNHIIRPDLMDPKKGYGVWAFVGPVPEFIKPVETKAVEKEAPKGLAAMGHLAGATIAPPVDVRQPDGSIVKVPGRSVITFVFGDGPAAHKRPFAVGDDDPIEDKELKSSEPRVVSEPKPRRPGKYLVSIEYAGEEEKNVLVKIVYDELGDDPTKPDRKTETLPIKQDRAPDKPRFGALAGAGPDGSKPGAAGTGSKVAPVAPGTPAGAPPPVSAPATTRFSTTLVRENHWKVEIPDDVSFSEFSGKTIDDIVSGVSADDVDPKSDPRGGAKLTRIPPNSIANSFGVQPGDILRSINGTPVHSRNEAIEVVKRIPKDTQSVIVVMTRDGQDRTYDVDPRDPKVRAAAGKVRFNK